MPRRTTNSTPSPRASASGVDGIVTRPSPVADVIPPDGREWLRENCGLNVVPPGTPTPPIPDDGEECVLPPDAGVAGDNRNPRRRDRERHPSDVGVLVDPEDRHSLDRIILHDEARADIITALRSLDIREELERVFGINAIQNQTGRCVLNFYGPPGTGKTLAALGIAHRLGKPLYQVDYSSVISKYLGDTAKHIVTAFKRAKEEGAILFFDEADSLMSKRIDMDGSCATSINQNRNVLMQELDRFDSVVVMTTNLFGNFDAAMLRRIAKHVRFDLPNRAMRIQLFNLHLPKKEQVTANLATIGTESRGLSGGDILNVCVNAMHAASVPSNPADWRITDTILLDQVERVKRSKTEHSGQLNP